MTAKTKNLPNKLPITNHQLRLEYVPLDTCKLWDKNPKKHDLAQIEASIYRYGFQDPAKFDETLGGLIFGNGRTEALVKARKAGKEPPSGIMLDDKGAWCVPVLFGNDLASESAASAFAIDHNNLTMAGSHTLEDMAKMWSAEGYQSLMQSLKSANDMPITAWMPKDDKPDPGAQMDKAEELLKKWKVKTGDLWEIGAHRLLCGDSTSQETYIRLMNGKAKAAMCVTSPPYGVGKSYETKGVAPWFETIRPVIINSCNHSKIVVWQLGDLYSTGSQFIEPTSTYSINMFSEHGYKLIWIRIWEKQGLNFGVAPYHLASNKPAQQYEYLLGLSEDDEQTIDATEFEWITCFAEQTHKYVKRLTKADRKAWGYAGVWKINTVKANDDHPAMFPVELPERCIKMHSDEGDEVLEPFSGSGTTLVACERLGRKGRAIEIAPKYVAVALERLSGMGLIPKRIK